LFAPVVVEAHGGEVVGLPELAAGQQLLAARGVSAVDRFVRGRVVGVGGELAGGPVVLIVACRRRIRSPQLNMN
jgi:hypothetical protein